jgi:hypothetical protein
VWEVENMEKIILGLAGAITGIALFNNIYTEYKIDYDKIATDTERVVALNTILICIIFV